METKSLKYADTTFPRQHADIMYKSVLFFNYMVTCCILWRENPDYLDVFMLQLMEQIMCNNIIFF